MVDVTFSVPSSSGYNEDNEGNDQLDQLNTGDVSSLTNHKEVWTLDTLGNWSSFQQDSGSAVSRTHNYKNEATAVGSNSLTFDDNGNTTKDESGQTYIFDAWNRLVTVKNSSSTTIAAYTYDALGRRVQETHSSTTTDCYFDSQWQLIDERQGSTSSSTILDQYVWSMAYVDGLVLRDSGSGLSTRYYAQQDANWNTTAIIDTSGNVKERFVYDPYGNVQVLDASGASTTDSYSWIYLHQGGRLDTRRASMANYAMNC